MAGLIAQVLSYLSVKHTLAYEFPLINAHVLRQQYELCTHVCRLRWRQRGYWMPWYLKPCKHEPS